MPQQTTQQPEKPTETGGRVGPLVIHPLVEYVEWLDSGGRDGWHQPDEECDAMQCVSIGWITAESDTAITLTAHMQVKPRFHHSDITIPKCAITKRVKLYG